MHRSSSRTGEIAAGYAQTLDLIIPVQEPMFYSGMIYVNEECNEGGTVIMIAQDKKLTPNFGFILKIAMDHVLGQELPRKGQWEVKGCVIFMLSYLTAVAQEKLVLILTQHCLIYSL